MINIENANVSYQTDTGELSAIENISFKVEKGEFLSIVGPSGCGKTTLLSLIAGLIKPDGGIVDCSGASTGYMLQKDHLFEWRTVHANACLPLEICANKTKENIRRIDVLLEKYGLVEFADKKPHELSGGMRQRAALIRTLARDPEILLLDEPFSALDYQTRLNVAEDIWNVIKAEKKTAVLVTHDIGEAISMSDRILVLSNRPATVRAEFNAAVFEGKTPLQRRQDTQFSMLFNSIWREIESHE